MCRGCRCVPRVGYRSVPIAPALIIVVFHATPLIFSFYLIYFCKRVDHTIDITTFSILSSFPVQINLIDYQIHDCNQSRIRGKCHNMPISRSCEEVCNMPSIPVSIIGHCKTTETKEVTAHQPGPANKAIERCAC